jgi:hypothetical protein
VQARIQTDPDVGHVKFFRGRLLALNLEEISKWIDSMDKEIDSIRREALRLTWYMRGGVNYDQALQLSLGERKIINEIVAENMETTKKSGLPFF